MFSLLSLLDDVATTLDDVAAMSQVAIKNTSALMSDDLAVNAGVVVGVSPQRELPIVKSIFIGSLWNKVYCVSGVLILSYVYPPLVNWLMLLGGVYLSFEGVHKIFEKVFHSKESSKNIRKQMSERDKVKGAVRTDLILSGEIVVIAKSSIEGTLMTEITTLIVVSLAASILIYGLVAMIVKIDDLGLNLIKRGYKVIGSSLVKSMPFIMKFLGIVGTVAMLLVGGGIIVHIFHIPQYLPGFLQNLILGLLVGSVLVVPLEIKQKLA